jgi:L-fucose isomerase-like protein
MPVNLVALFSDITPQESVKSILGRIDRLGARVYGPEEFELEVESNPSILNQHNYLFIGTGGTEKAAVNLLDAVQLPEPLVLVAHDRSNSLPAALEIRAYADERGMEAQVVHDSLERLASRIKTWVGHVEVEEKIRKSRLGVIGNPSFWLVASQVDPVAVKRRWGLDIEHYDLSELTERLSDNMGRDQEKAMKKHARDARQVEVPDEDLSRASLVAQALARVADERNLQVVTLECFRLLEETGISGCYAVSEFNDLPDVVAGCEGDVPAAFTMFLAKLLTGRASFMANVAQVDERNNTAVFSHCTVPLSMVQSYETVTHFETGLSVGLRGSIEPQPVTVFKVHGLDLSDWWISSGEIVENLRNDNGCRTQVRVVLDAPVSYFLETSLANHHILILGDHTEEISAFMDFV